MKGKMRQSIAVLLTVTGFTPSATAQDVEAGFLIARRWCSGCHEIGRAPVQNDVSPPFVAIARMTSTTNISLNAFLSTSHNRMPDYSLTRREIADVSAYILSLKSK